MRVEGLDKFKQDDRYIYNKSVKFDKDAMRKSLEHMVPRHLEFKHKYLEVFPQYGLMDHVRKYTTDETELGRWLFLAAVTDRMKDSLKHHPRDIKRIIDLAYTGVLDKLFSSNGERLNSAFDLAQLDFATQQKSSYNIFEFMQQIGSNDYDMNVFMRKFLRVPNPTYDTYVEKKKQGIRQNMDQDRMCEMIHTFNSVYASNPLQVLDTPDPMNAFLDITNVGPGGSFLALTYFIDAGLTKLTPRQLGMTPKVDFNDLILTKLAGVYNEDSTKKSKEVYIDIIRHMMYHAAIDIGVSVKDADEAYWASSQVYSKDTELGVDERYAPIYGLVSKAEFAQYGSGAYYGQGIGNAKRKKHVVDPNQYSLL